MLLGESYRLKLIQPALQDFLFLCAESFQSCYPVVGHGATVDCRNPGLG